MHHQDGWIAIGGKLTSVGVVNQWENARYISFSSKSVLLSHMFYVPVYRTHDIMSFNSIVGH